MALSMRVEELVAVSEYKRSSTSTFEDAHISTTFFQPQPPPGNQHDHLVSELQAISSKTKRVEM